MKGSNAEQPLWMLGSPTSGHVADNKSQHPHFFRGRNYAQEREKGRPAAWGQSPSSQCELAVLINTPTGLREDL